MEPNNVVSKAQKRRNAKLAKRVKRLMNQPKFDWTRLNYILNHDTDGFLTNIIQTLCEQADNQKGDSSCS